MRKPNRKRALAAASVALLLLVGVVLLQWLRRFPPAQAQLGLWQMIVRILIIMAMYIAWHRGD